MFAAARGVMVTTLLVELLTRSKRAFEPSIALLKADVRRAERLLERVQAQLEKLEVRKGGGDAH